MSAHSHPVGAPHQGFVLLAVMVFLVVITLIAGMVASVSERVLAEAATEDEQLQAAIEMADTRDTLFFLLATQRQTVSGLTIDDTVVTQHGQATWAPDGLGDSPLPPPFPVGTELALDGTPYAANARIRFALQDAGGLFSVNWTPPVMRAGFLRQLGASPEQDPGLEAMRLDYQDEDSLYRLGGAEQRQYQAAGLLPPSNQGLLTPLELRQVMGWRTLLEPWSDAQVASMVTTSRVVGLNLNTAPATSLAMLPGLDQASIQRILALRKVNPFLLPWEFRKEFPLLLDEEEPLLLLPTGAGTLCLWDNLDGRIELIHWTLTPIDEGGRPWRIDYQFTLPRDDALAERPARTPATPLFSAQRSPEQ